MKKIKLRISNLLRIELTEENAKLVKENKQLKDDNDKLSKVHEIDMTCINELFKKNKNLGKEIGVLTEENIKLMSIVRHTKDLKAI